MNEDGSLSIVDRDVFDCYTASLRQAMRWKDYESRYVAHCFAVIGAFRCPLLFRLADVVPS